MVKWYHTGFQTRCS